MADERKGKSVIVPGITPGLDSYSAFTPPWCDTAAAMERIVAEAAQLEDAQKEAKALGRTVEVPESGKSGHSLDHSQKLVALLLACGASVLDIAMEMGTDAQTVSQLETNLLIIKQIKNYKERFWGTDSQAQLQGMLPQALKYVSEVLEKKNMSVDASKELETARWLIEKVTGKATQQIDMSSSLNFGTLLDEMRKMREARDAVLDGSQHAIDGSHKIIDVTPVAPKPDEFTQWVTDFHKEANE